MLVTQSKIAQEITNYSLSRKKVEIWIDSRRVEGIDMVSSREKIFLQQFISNLEDMGWTVMI